MTEKIIRKIEEIRQKPEHIRLQYTLGIVLVCMVFVIGIWILTLRQGFMGMADEVSSSKQQAEETITSVKEALPNSDSLRDLKESSEPLRVNSNESNADQFIESELGRTPPDPNLTTNPVPTE